MRLAQLQSASAASVASQPQGDAAAAVAAEGEPLPGLGAAGTPAAPAAGDAAAPLDMQQLVFPLRPIGILRSCFSRRNGTPRQPLLVPAARAQLTLRTELSEHFLEGLAEYSHW